jgi:hypothetical protein
MEYVFCDAIRIKYDRYYTYDLVFKNGEIKRYFREELEELVESGQIRVANLTSDLKALEVHGSVRVELDNSDRTENITKKLVKALKTIKADYKESANGLIEVHKNGNTAYLRCDYYHLYANLLYGKSEAEIVFTYLEDTEEILKRFISSVLGGLK